jgi:hypothetical protein
MCLRCLLTCIQLLGRASSIGDYVKRGEESGWVKVSLCGHSPGQTIKITRKINKQSKSEWIIEGTLLLPCYTSPSL